MSGATLRGFATYRNEEPFNFYLVGLERGRGIDHHLLDELAQFRPAFLHLIGAE